MYCPANNPLAHVAFSLRLFLGMERALLDDYLQSIGLGVKMGHVCQIIIEKIK